MLHQRGAAEEMLSEYLKVAVWFEISMIVDGALITNALHNLLSAIIWRMSLAFSWVVVSCGAIFDENA